MLREDTVTALTYVDKYVARHFNAANLSISNIKVCAISPTKSVSFLKLEPFIPTGSMDGFLLFDPFIVSVFVQHGRTKAVTSHSIVYVHPPPTYSLRASASFTDRL